MYESSIEVEEQGMGSKYLSIQIKNHKGKRFYVVIDVDDDQNHECAVRIYRVHIEPPACIPQYEFMKEVSIEE